MVKLERRKMKGDGKMEKDSLEKRIEELEAKNEIIEARFEQERKKQALWKYISAGLIIIILGFMLFHQAEDATAQTRTDEIIIRDSSGKRRIFISLVEGGDPVISMLDKNGDPRLGMGVIEGNPSFTKFDSNGKIIWYSGR